MSILSDRIICQTGVIASVLRLDRLEEQRRRIIGQMMNPQAKTRGLLVGDNLAILHPAYGDGRIAFGHRARHRQPLAHLNAAGQMEWLDHRLHYAQRRWVSTLGFDETFFPCFQSSSHCGVYKIIL